MARATPWLAVLASGSLVTRPERGPREVLAWGIESHPRQGPSDWQLEDVRGTDDRVAVAFSWRTADGSRTNWAQVLNLERGKIVAMQD